MSKLAGCLSATLLTFSLTSAHAVTTSYFSEADYLSALGSAGTITYDFDSMVAGTLIADGSSVDGATFSYVLVSPGASIMVDTGFDTTSPANYLGTDDGSGAFVGGDAFTITFDQTMYAVGLYVISADLIFGGDFTITTSGGQSVSNSSIADLILSDGDAFFIGLIESDFSLGFDSITLSSFDAAYLFNVDDITVSAVPLPAAVWLFGSGLLGLAGVSRRNIHKS